jgi:glycine cleavage system T protein
MNQVIEQSVNNKLPLEKSHEQLGASFGEQDGWLIPKSYGDVASEYKAVRENAGLMDLSPRGRVRVSGSEAIMFLNGLITNDMKTLAEHHWMSAVFPNVQGRIIAAVRVVRLGNEVTESASPTFLLDTEAPTYARLLKTIERFTMAGDFRVNDITNDTALLSIQGINAAAIATQVLGATVAELPRDGALEIGWEQSSVIVMRATHTSEDGFDLIVDSAHAAALWQALSEAGAQPVGYDALETLRIEAGIGRYGRDMDETNVVTEANLDDAVSYTKGCYIGQEIIARIKYRGHVAKKLTGLLFEKEVVIEAGASIRSVEGKDIGRVTSTVLSPKLGRTIALGYVRYEHLDPGTRLLVGSGEDEVAATINELPFDRGSWYHS